METITNDTKKEQEKAIEYYDSFSNVYDLSANWYYKKARQYAIKELHIEKGQTILNVPCGTGVNFKYFNEYLNGSGLIIGIDLSSGMLEQAKKKIKKNNWTNIKIELNDATKIDSNWLKNYSKQNQPLEIDSIFFDLGLSGFPDWEKIIDNAISILKPNGRIVILDWYLKKNNALAKLIKWIGKGEVNRPIYQYLETKVSDFSVKENFGIVGGVFVCSGTKK